MLGDGVDAAICHTEAVIPLLFARLHVDLQRVVSAACR
jgi:hypothetical protein